MDQTLVAECLDLEHEEGMGSLSAPPPTCLENGESFEVQIHFLL